MSRRISNDPQEKTFEDFALGDVVITRGRTVDIGDISLFSGLTGDHYPLHTDEEYGKSTRFGTRIAHGPLTFALAVGLVGMSGFYGNAITALETRPPTTLTSAMSMPAATPEEVQRSRSSTQRAWATHSTRGPCSRAHAKARLLDVAR